MSRLGKRSDTHQEPDREQPISSSLDLFGHGLSHSGLAGNDPVEMGLDTANLEPDEAQGPTFEFDVGAKVSHASQFVVALQTCQEVKNETEDPPSNNTGMAKTDERWPQRTRYLELLAAWRHRTGKGLSDFALEVGKSPQLLYSYNSRPETRPPEPLMRRMAEVLGCRITDLLSDPGATIVGQSVDGLSEKAQVLAEMAFAKFRDEDLSDDDRQMLYEDWMKDYDRLKAMKARHSK